MTITLITYYQNFREHESYINSEFRNNSSFWMLVSWAIWVTFLNPRPNSTVVHAKSLQSCPTICNLRTVARQTPLSMGILQERILEWIAMPFSRRTSQPRNQTRVSCILYQLSYQRSLDRPWGHDNKWGHSVSQWKTNTVYHLHVQSKKVKL